MITTPPQANPRATPHSALPVVDPLLFIHVTSLGDLEKQRVANQQRYEAMIRQGPDEDGITRGWGLSDTHPDVKRLKALIGALLDLEHQAEITLRGALRRSPLYPWIKGQIGMGDRQVARLLGAIGDPYWHMSEDRPRTVSELWAYCGLHVLPADHRLDDTQSGSVGGAQTSDPGQSVRALGGQTAFAGVAARRRKGHQSNWSTEAKTRAYLIALTCTKFRGGTDTLGRNLPVSPYRVAYDQRRLRTAETHPDWTPLHSHNDGLRIASKTMLRDLWREARRIHMEGRG